MTDSVETAKDRIRRSIGAEFVRMEDDFDRTRDIRTNLINKLAAASNDVNILGEGGALTDDTEPALKVIATTLKALSDVEKASAQAIALKLKNQEQEMASSAAAKDRVAMVLLATAPGKITETFPSEELEAKLDELFSNEIKDFELKSNSRDLVDE